MSLQIVMCPKENQPDALKNTQWTGGNNLERQVCMVDVTELLLFRHNSLVAQLVAVENLPAMQETPV